MTLSYHRGVTTYSQLSGAPNAPFAYPTIRLIGDSIVSQNDLGTPAATGVTTASIVRYFKFWNWVVFLSGEAIPYVISHNPAYNQRTGSNSGKGGDDMQEIADRLQTILSTMPEKYLFFHCGTNDINDGQSLATCIARATNLIRMTRASGKIPIFSTVLPRNAVDGANDWGATGTTAAQKRLILASYNEWLRQYCQENNVLCIDWYAVFVNASGDAITGYTADGLHPSGRGSWYLAQEVIRQTNGLFPKARRGQVGLTDVYDATYNPYGNILNGDLSGTGGITADAGGIGTVTGTIPDNWRLNKATSTTTSVAYTTTTRSDTTDTVGQLTFTTTGGGSATEQFRFEYWNGSSTTLSSYTTAGELYMFTCDMRITGTHASRIKNIGLRLGNSSAVSKTGTTVSFNATTNTINDSANGFGSFANGIQYYIEVSGSTSNNSVFLVTAASAGTLTISSTTPVVAESAGATVTVANPALSIVVGTTTDNMPNVDTGWFTIQSSYFISAITGNSAPRLDFYIDGTVGAGTGVVQFSSPKLSKVPITPSLLSYIAHDT